jgi:hypothetical protein
LQESREQRQAGSENERMTNDQRLQPLKGSKRRESNTQQEE